MPALSASKLKELAQMRLDEAESLFHAGFYPGAWYICGYVLEMALKACICRALAVLQYPDEQLRTVFRTHKFDELVLLASLREKLKVRLRDPDFRVDWDYACTWSPDVRYDPERSRDDVERLLAAYRDPQNGVFVWLSSQW